MKVLYTLLFISLFTNCGTKSAQMVLSEDTPYKGNWILTKKSRGITGTNVELKKVFELQIDNDVINYYENSKLVLTKPFKTTKGKTIQSTDSLNVMIGNTIPKQSIQLHNDQLIITDQCYDCFTYIYKRK